MTPRTAPLLLALALACTAAPQDPAPAPAPVAPPPPQPPVTVTVTVEAAGLTPTDVERSLAEPLELALAGVPELTRMLSESRSGRAELTLTFRPTTAPASAMVAVQAALQAALPVLPEDTLPVLRAGHDPHAAVMFTLQSATMPADQLSGVADTIRDALLTVPDVTHVALCGRRTPEIEVTLDLPRLTALGVAPAAVLEALRADPGDVPLTGARINPRGIEDLGTIALAARDPPVQLRDVATVRRSSPIDTCDAIRLGGEPVLLGVVHARRGVHPGDFKKSIQGQLDAQRARLPARDIGLATPEVAPLRISVDLEATGDPTRALADNAARLEKLLQAADLQVRAYLQAPIPALPGERYTGDLFVLPTSEDEAASLRLALSQQLTPIGAIGSVADPEDDPQRHPAWVRGPSLDADRQLAASLVSRLHNVPGVQRTRSSDILNPALVVEIDRDILGAAGLRQRDIQPVLAIALGGAAVATLHEGRVATRVVVRLPAASDQTIADRITQLRALSVTPTNGAPVRLDSLLTLTMELQPAAIVRLDRQRAVRVDLYYSDRQAREAAQAMAAAALELPPGHAIVWE